MRKIKEITVVLAAILSTLFFVGLTSNLAYADTKSAIQSGVCEANGLTADECKNQTPVKDLNNTIANVINILSAIVGIVAVIIIIVAGFKYVTSAGNDQTVASAKKTLLYAIIGLIVVALAQIIVKFVLNKTTVFG